MPGNAIIDRTRDTVAKAQDSLKDAEVAIQMLQAVGEVPTKEIAEFERAKARLGKLKAFIDAKK
jgi:hypothetical protein